MAPTAASAHLTDNTRRLTSAVVAACVVSGVALRVWIFRADISPTESDEAVLGLMAMHIARGQFQTMYWGQPYGGPVEAFLAAPVFALAGPSVIVTKLVGTALCAVSSLLTWRIGRRTVGEPGASIGAALFWTWPVFFVWYSTKISIYFGSLTLALAVVLLLFQLRDRDQLQPTWRWPASFGLASGLAFWASPQTLFLLVPAGVALGPALLRNARRVALSLPFAVIGAAPWIAFNARNEWASLHVPPVDVTVSYLDRVRGFFPQLPIILGLRMPWNEEWLSRTGGIVVSALVCIAVGVGAVVASGRARPVYVIALLVPLAYAASPLSVYTGGSQPRYLLTLMPVLALVIASALWGVARFARAPAALSVGLVAALVVGAVGVTVEGFQRAEQMHLGWIPAAPDAVTPPQFDDLHALLTEHRVRYAYADYWVSYRAMFESHERVVIDPIQPNLQRYAPYSRAVEASPHPALIALAASGTYPLITAKLDKLGVSYRRYERGNFALILPDRKVSPIDLVGAYYLLPE